MTAVPVLSLADLRGGATLAALDDACRTWGVFHVVDHGVDPALARRVLDLAGAFFALPQAEKGAIERTAENPWGYYDRELTKNVRDWKEIFDVGPAEGGARPQWPATPPRFREAMEAWFEACSTLARSLIGAIATNLGAPPETLTACFDEATSFLRLNHYPPCDDPAPADSPTVPTAGRLGIGHHTDAGAVTVLLQDERPGLQVERGGTWHLVPPVADALTVNLGDVVQVWSNDRYHAPSHRVLADRERPRTSAPFFLNPSSSTTYAPLEGACRDAPPRYRPISWREFRAARAAGDYADVGEEIQISHFRR